jgi:hypothetical protein
LRNGIFGMFQGALSSILYEGLRLKFWLINSLYLMVILQLHYYVIYIGRMILNDEWETICEIKIVAYIEYSDKDCILTDENNLQSQTH